MHKKTPHPLILNDIESDISKSMTFIEKIASQVSFLMPLGSAELCSCLTSPLLLSYPAHAFG